DRERAGAHRLAVDVHRAGAALREAAAEARAVQAEIVPQGVEQRHLRIVYLDRARLAVEDEGNRFRHDIGSRYLGDRLVPAVLDERDRKSTRLNSSHGSNSYGVS